MTEVEERGDDPRPLAAASFLLAALTLLSQAGNLRPVDPARPLLGRIVAVAGIGAGLLLVATAVALLGRHPLRRLAGSLYAGCAFAVALLQLFLLPESFGLAVLIGLVCPPVITLLLLRRQI